MKAARFGVGFAASVPAPGVLAAARAAEELGYDSVWGNDHMTTQNYVRAEFPVPPRFWEPLMVYAFVLSNTTTLKVGTGVLVLPMRRDIVVTAKQIATLDHFGKGRLEIGVGIGAYREEFKALQPDSKLERGDIVDEGLQALRLLFADRVASFEGKYYRYTAVPMELQPYQKPHPPLWYGIGRADAVPWAAARAVNIVGNVTGAMMRPITDRYRAEWRALGREPSDLPLMGLSRHVVVAETEREALAVASRGYQKWRDSFLLLWRKHNMQLPNPNALFPETFEEAEGEGRAVAGPPEKVRAFLQRQIDAGGLNYLLCRFAFGDIEPDEALHSLDLFTRHVMSDLHEAKLED